jgi:hypothetical protein
MTPWFYPLRRTSIYRPKVGSGQKLDKTNRHSTSPKTPPVLQHLIVLPNKDYDRMEQEETHIWAKEYPSSSHYIELVSIVQKLVR